MAYGKKGGLKTKRKRIPVPGYSDMIRAKRMAEVQTFREDLRQAEIRRNHLLELGNIRSALCGKLSPTVQHPLHNRRDENAAMFLDTLSK